MTSYNKNDPTTIQEMFNSIAENYDKTNAILSFQMHKRWNQTLIEKTLIASHPDSILDLCCGTGAIAFEYLKQISVQSHDPAPSKIYMLDFSVEMLAFARKKAEAENLNRYNITYLQADAQSIPLPDNTIECATIAYGIRNVKLPQQCLKDVYRVLKKGGTFGILELTQPTNPLLRLGHGLYLRTILPVMGKIFTSNENAYRYLCNSIHSFIQPEALKDLMRAAGYVEIRSIPLMGGIATILIGKKL
ncbi:MAG: bifunctional demethylmenaquinone methyltransferase/2-methoxy-6-polyprenyl-1,4-benzoquinol methylase UbiE [Parachlamydiaceae bacterium]|nr:bifunctional demethylmenaquinone methyltransferase/2-methoxy-6-polyprenyl-1,4-benzoquinol methylase UbiE [Parachlamydiaceae bacterium]